MVAQSALPVATMERGLNCSSIALDFCCTWSDRLALQTFKNTFTITVIDFVWEAVGIISSLGVFLWSSRLCVSMYVVSLELWSSESTEDLEAARQEKASAGLIAVADKVECSFPSLSFFRVCVRLHHVVHQKIGSSRSEGQAFLIHLWGRQHKRQPSLLMS